MPRRCARARPDASPTRLRLAPSSESASLPVSRNPSSAVQPEPFADQRAGDFGGLDALVVEALWVVGDHGVSPSERGGREPLGEGDGDRGVGRAVNEEYLQSRAFGRLVSLCEFVGPPSQGDPEPLSNEQEDFLRVPGRTLMYVSGAAHGSGRMGDVAAATALSLGAVTRVVTRLESKGLLDCSPSAPDGRVHEVVLTEALRKRLDQALPAHVASVRRCIFDKLDGLDMQMCTTALLSISADIASEPIHGWTRA